MFGPSREQARQFFFDAWRKYQQREMLTAMEDMALEVILLHPEYQRMLEMPERYQDKDYLPEMGDTNPQTFPATVTKNWRRACRDASTHGVSCRNDLAGATRQDGAGRDRLLRMPGPAGK